MGTGHSARPIPRPWEPWMQGAFWLPLLRHCSLPANLTHSQPVTLQPASPALGLTPQQHSRSPRDPVSSQLGWLWPTDCGPHPPRGGSHWPRLGPWALCPGCTVGPGGIRSGPNEVLSPGSTGAPWVDAGTGSFPLGFFTSGAARGESCQEWGYGHRWAREGPSAPTPGCWPVGRSVPSQRLSTLIVRETRPGHFTTRKKLWNRR